MAFYHNISADFALGLFCRSCLFCLTFNNLTTFTGIGGGCLYAGSYSAVASYFTGNQLAPFVSMTTFGSVGTLTAPKVIRKLSYVLLKV